MAWTYNQVDGTLTDPGGKVVGRGYSGHGEGKNNPAMQHVPDVGPIPQGTYHIGPAYSDSEKGPTVMPLSPFPGTDTHGRSGFLMHGDSIASPGTASHGCIIQGRYVRELVAASTDRTLQVV